MYKYFNKLKLFETDKTYYFYYLFSQLFLHFINKNKIFESCIILKRIFIYIIDIINEIDNGN